MGKPRIPQKQIDLIKKLRQTGHSLPEIRKIVGRGNSTVFKYIQGVGILPDYIDIWRVKQGGSKKRSELNWQRARAMAEKQFPKIGAKEKKIVLLSLYWGEGSRSELCLSNTDPSLVKAYVECLKEFGVKKKELKATLRIYGDIDKNNAVNFWSKVLCISKRQFGTTTVLSGKKKGKLKYGMCRVRVEKSGQRYKVIYSMMELLKASFDKALNKNIMW